METFFMLPIMSNLHLGQGGETPSTVNNVRNLVRKDIPMSLNACAAS